MSALDYAGKDELFNLGNGRPVLLDDFIDVVEKSLSKCVVAPGHCYRDHAPEPSCGSPPGDCRQESDQEHAAAQFG
jgi:hypothetical protein